MISRIERIAALHKLETEYMIKNDVYSQNARVTNQEVKPMITPSESEMLDSQVTSMPQSVEYDTGEVDELGQAIMATKAYNVPEDGPALEEEPAFIDKEDVLMQRERLERDISAGHKKYAELENLKKRVLIYISGLNEKLNHGHIDVKEFSQQMHKCDERVTEIEAQLSDCDFKIRNKTTQTDMIDEELNNHNAMVFEVKKRNRIILRNYVNEVNSLNNTDINIVQGPNESDSDFYLRIKQHTEGTEPTHQLRTAINNTIKLFKFKMKEIVTDPSKIESVSNALDKLGKADNKFEIIKKWTNVKSKFLEMYGFNNKQVSTQEIIKFLDTYLKSEHHAASSINTKTSTDYISTKVIDGSETLDVKNYKTEKSVYFRVVESSRRNERGYPRYLLYSFSNETGTYKQYFDAVIPSDRKANGRGNSKMHSSKEIFERTGISFDDLKKILNITKPDDVCNRLVNEFSIRPVAETEERVSKSMYGLTAGGKQDKTQYGMGVHTETLPQYVPFGDVIILLRKLFYENVFSVRNHNMKAITGFRTSKVSEQFVKLIMNIIKGIHPTHSDISELKVGEKQIYDRLITLAKLNKEMPHQKDTTISELKKRLKLLESEIEIGNNSPLIKKEIYGILHTLKDFRTITQSQINSYLTKNF